MPYWFESDFVVDGFTTASNNCGAQVSDGTLAPGDAVQIGTLLKIRAELTGLAELEQRLAKLETELKEHK
jgi:hypothetical protein